MCGKVFLTDGSGRYFFRGRARIYKGTSTVNVDGKKAVWAVYHTRAGAWVLVHERVIDALNGHQPMSATLIEDESEIVDWMIRHNRNPACLAEKISERKAALHINGEMLRI
jgi:hypothetical protein